MRRNKKESYRTKRDDKGKMRWVPMSEYVSMLFRKRRKKRK
jgi:hypothetical protein